MFIQYIIFEVHESFYDGLQNYTNKRLTLPFLLALIHKYCLSQTLLASPPYGQNRFEVLNNNIFRINFIRNVIAVDARVPGLFAKMRRNTVVSCIQKYTVNTA